MILHDIIHSPVKLTFVFEYVDTDLSKHMELNPGGLAPNEAKLFLFQLVRGLGVLPQAADLAPRP